MFPNPFDIPTLFKDAYNALFKLLMDFLGFSINFDNLDLVKWLYGNVSTFAPWIAGVIFIVILPAAIMIRRFHLSGVMAFGAVVFTTAFAPLWFIFISAMRSVGSGATLVAASIGSQNLSDGKNILVLPSMSFASPIIAGALFGGLLTYTFIFLQLFLTYEIANVIFTALGLLLIALYGFGPRTRRLFSMLVAFGIVTMLIGRPVAILIMKIGNLIANGLPTNDVFWVGMITSASMFFALVSQIILPFVMYRSVHNVLGSMNAKVRNLVRSQIENKHKIDARVSGKVDTATSNRMRSIDRHRHTDSFKHEVKRAAAATAAASLAKKAATLAANVHPAVKLAVTVAPIALRAIGNARPKQREPKPRRFDDYRA